MKTGKKKLRFIPQFCTNLTEKARNGERLDPNEPRFDCLQLGLTGPMEILEKRIEVRLDARLRAGMLDEVRDYLSACGEPSALIDLGLEYRFIYFYLSGQYKSEQEFKAALSTAIRQFSKRQLTWFRRDPSIHWLDCRGDYTAEATERIADFLR